MHLNCFCWLCWKLSPIPHPMEFPWQQETMDANGTGGEHKAPNINELFYRHLYVLAHNWKSLALNRTEWINQISLASSQWHQHFNFLPCHFPNSSRVPALKPINNLLIRINLTFRPVVYPDPTSPSRSVVKSVLWVLSLPPFKWNNLKDEVIEREGEYRLET